jgi:hypothetical protein
MKKKKVKKSKNSKKPVRRLKTDRHLDEHVVKIIEESDKKEIKQSIDAVVKKASKKREVKAKKAKKNKKGRIKDIYGKGSKRDEYRGLQGAGVYDQIKFSNFTGFIYKSNIKGNAEFYQHLGYESALEKHQVGSGEKNLVSSEGLDDYGRKTMMNFLIGSPMMTSGMSAVTFEEMEVTKFSLYDRTQNILYTAKLRIMGFGDQGQAFGSFGTTLKTMHAPRDKAA